MEIVKLGKYDCFNLNIIIGQLENSRICRRMDTKCQYQRRCINFYFLYTDEPFSCDYIYQMRPRNIEYCEFNIHDKKLYFIIDHATALIAWRKAYDEWSIVFVIIYAAMVVIIATIRGSMLLEAV